MELSEYLNRIKTHPDFGRAFVHCRYIPPVEPHYGSDTDMSPELSRILKKNGISDLYIHQTRAIEHIRHDENVIISTPTASGKSLIYNLAVLKTLMKKKNQKPLYVFPLKALEQDQLKNLSNLLNEIKGREISAEK